MLSCSLWLQGWNLFVSEKEFADVLRKVEMTIAFRKGRERGSFSYGDLTTLTENSGILEAIQALLLEATKVCSITHLVGIVLCRIKTVESEIYLVSNLYQHHYEE